MYVCVYYMVRRFLLLRTNLFKSKDRLYVNIQYNLPLHFRTE